VAITPRAGAAIDDARVVTALRSVLAQEKFRYSDPVTGNSPEERGFFQRLIEKIEEKIVSLREYLAGFLKATTAVAFLIYGLILVAVGALAVYVIRRIDPGGSGGKRRGAVGPDEAYSLDYERELGRAKLLADQGRHREAVQAAMGALWLYYNFTSAFAYRRSATNREYLRALGEREEYEHVRDIVYRGEAAIYAHGEVSEDQSRKICRDVEGLTAR